MSQFDLTDEQRQIQEMARAFTARAITPHFVGAAARTRSTMNTPTPVACHTFRGCEPPSFGDPEQHGREGGRFSTNTKKVARRRPDGGAAGKNAVPTATVDPCAA